VKLASGRQSEKSAPDGSLSKHSPIGRGEFLILLAAILVGAVLRCGPLGRLAIEHFDEAVYAANLLVPVEAGGQYPNREFFAPYLWPLILEWWSIVAGGTANWLPMVPGLLSGIAMIPTMWWIARTWYGTTAGLTAAWLSATSGIHMAYSGTALTDAPVALAMVWAVYWGICALEQPAWRSIVLAGFFTGLGWSIKYSGWLPIAIVAAGGALSLVLERPRREGWTKLLVVVGGMTAVAVVVWLPAWIDLQDVGGYSAVSVNHAGYARSGLMAWGSGAWAQWSNLLSYNHWAAAIGAAITGALGIWWGTGHVLRPGPVRNRAVAALWGALALFAQTYRISLEFALLVLLVFAWWLARRNFDRCEAPEDRNLALRELRPLCCLMAWAGGLLLTLPLYTPYPRLMLSLLPALWLGGGAWMAVFCGSTRFARQRDGRRSAEEAAANRAPERVRLMRNVKMVGFWLVYLTVSISLGTTMRWPLWEDRSTTARAMESLVRSNLLPSDSVVLCWDEPVAWYHLARRGQLATVITGPRSFEQTASGNVYVIVDEAKWQALNEDRDPASESLQHVETIELHESSIVQLDRVSMATLKRNPSAGVRGLVLLRLGR
jgi:hypothetical protein